MAAPVGYVERLRQYFQSRLDEHNIEPYDYDTSEPDGTLIERAIYNTNELILQSRNYGERLRTIQSLTLSHLPQHPIDFLRDHDNLHRSVMQSTRLSSSTADMDVLTRESNRIVFITNTYHYHMVRATFDPVVHNAMVEDDAGLKQDFCDAVTSLTQEILLLLGRLQNLLPRYDNDDHDAGLENVGEDHDPDDFGKEVTGKEVTLYTTTAKSVSNEEKGAAATTTDHPTTTTGTNGDQDANDPAVRCCICLEPYTTTTTNSTTGTDPHPAFLLSPCAHIVGKPCFTAWLNSTATNSTTCPHCRTQLCERRPRRAVPVPIPNRNTNPLAPLILLEARLTTNRLNRIVDLLTDLAELFDTIFGAGDEWMGERIRALNRELCERGSSWGFVRDGLGGFVWRCERVEWVGGWWR